MFLIHENKQTKKQTNKQKKNLSLWRSMTEWVPDPSATRARSVSCKTVAGADTRKKTHLEFWHFGWVFLPLSYS